MLRNYRKCGMTFFALIAAVLLVLALMPVASWASDPIIPNEENYLKDFIEVTGTRDSYDLTFTCTSKFNLVTDPLTIWAYFPMFVSTRLGYDPYTTAFNNAFKTITVKGELNAAGWFYQGALYDYLKPDGTLEIIASDFPEALLSDEDVSEGKGFDDGWGRLAALTGAGATVNLTLESVGKSDNATNAVAVLGKISDNGRTSE
jgi:hypothetical protein